MSRRDVERAARSARHTLRRLRYSRVVWALFGSLWKLNRLLGRAARYSLRLLAAGVSVRGGGRGRGRWR